MWEKKQERKYAGKYEFKWHKCLSSNGHYFSMTHLFTEIFDSYGGVTLVCHCSTCGIIIIFLILLKNLNKHVVLFGAV